MKIKTFENTALEIATQIGINNKMPLRGIVLHFRDLANQLQLVVSNVEELKPKSEKQKKHVREIRRAVKEIIRIHGKIQNLAAIELDES